MSKKVTTLCFVHTDAEILLGMKKRGFGEGKWNGFGGKVAANETIEEAAKRELFEESGITAHELEKRGVVEFEFQGNPEIIEMHVFRATRHEGEPKESEEMRPRWFQHHEIPYTAMWPDDSIWLKHFLAGERFAGYFLFQGNDTILKHTLKIFEA